MERFQFTKARTVLEAIGIAAQSTTAQQGAPIRFLAGGTTLVDLMKLDVERPTRLVDINHLELNKIDFFFQGEDGIRDLYVTGVQTCAHPISSANRTTYPTALATWSVMVRTWVMIAE